MNSFYRNLKLKGKILIIVLPITTLFFTLVILYFSTNIKRDGSAEAKELVNSETQRYALLTKKIFDEAFSIAHTYTGAFIENMVLPADVRDSVNKKILLRTLGQNEDFLSVGLHYQIDALDPDYDKKNGRIRNISFKLNDKLYFSQNTADTTNEELSGLYYVAKEFAKPMVSNPYYDTHTPELEGILMVTVITSLVQDGKYLGQTGIDLALENIQQMVQSINPFELSVAYLVASNNKIVAHTDNSLFNKDLFEINKGYESEFENALNQIKSNTAFNFELEKGNEEFYISVLPIKVGEDGKHWALITETPLNVLIEKSNRLFRSTIIAGLIGLISLALIIYFLIDSITKRLLVAVKFAQKVSDGDLSSHIEFHDKDEIGQLAKSMNQMANKLKKMIKKITISSENMNTASSFISEYSSELSQGASGQAASAEEVMASIEEMGSNIHSNSENAQQTEKISNQTLIGVKNGSKSANQTLKSISEITEKISIINEISRQTNILSINAAIEAARAGQYGKGFGVVASEVKKLAERSQEAALSINELSVKGVDISALAEKELSTLVPEVEKTATLISEITNASREQSNGVDQIQSAVQSLTDVAQKNAAFSVELDDKAKILSKEADHLKAVINFFKI
ncbi:MAG: hypothetical protein DRJ10_16735 [Bacteroidetes bacterium]|nr:MAG: hypothetical protein DRJ10_16735 [Bacteroidota bacterium]